MHQLRLQTNTSAVERVEQLLFNCGAVSITYSDAKDEPILEPAIGHHPLWSALLIQAHFPSQDGINLASKALLHEDDIGSQIVIEEIHDDGWQEQFQQQFKAMHSPKWSQSALLM